MDTRQRLKESRVPAKLVRACVFCLACIALNAVGAEVALLLRLPVYLDTMGTVLASMLGGFVPGICVGYATNLVNGAFDSMSMYYGIVNVIIAVMVTYLAKRGWFRELHTTLAAIPVLAIASGLLGTLITYFITGTTGDQVSAYLSDQIVVMGLAGENGSAVLATLFTNFIDKSLVLLSCTLVYHMLPDSFLESLDFVPWRQRPLTQSEMGEVMSEKPRQASLRTKVVILIGVFVTFVAVATTAFSQITYHRAMVENETEKAETVCSLMEEEVDPNKVDTYLELGDDAPGYAQVERRLAKIRDSFDNVQYVYVYQIREDGCHVVLDPDTADEPGSDPGDVIPFDDSFAGLREALLSGQEIEPVISDETYGWLLTVYKPLKNWKGETVCYLAADISMAHLVADETSFMAGIVALFAAFFILACALVLWLSHYGVIVPVNSISHATSKFVLGEGVINAESLELLRQIEIRTGDEIENLYDTVVEMAQETVSYIDEVETQNDTISRMQSNLIMVMADIVESRDKFTGDHVRNTAAYTRIIMNQMRREGICADVLTNEFISNVYQSAPLHDIGKIAVSDTILNKPGRLTEEEFEIMKSHTIAGKEILESAKSAVSESSYLDEAQRLAAYHHEKWNGTGYPYGLAGEEIPLSARIMAVADVFDALVSKRSYKAGFPVEKAFAIIEEGIGTHFDPQVARAFLHARDKAAAVAEKSNEKKRLEEEQAQQEKTEKSNEGAR